MEVHSMIFAAALLLSVVRAEEEWTIVDHGDHTHRYRVVANENIYGSPLDGIICSTDPMTGWYRDGTCKTGPNDRGTHVVCAEMTQEFLDYTKSMGNDLSTPSPWGFPGLKPGNRWCLCALRWTQAYRAGKAPPVIPQATHKKALQFVGIDKNRMASCSVDNWIAASLSFRPSTCYS
jgi:uncharacterized protein (DUF2237 family)